MFIVLLVIFVMAMFMWLVGNLGALPAPANAWLPFIAVLILGIVVFLVGGGVVAMQRISHAGSTMPPELAKSFAVNDTDWMKDVQVVRSQKTVHVPTAWVQ